MTIRILITALLVIGSITLLALSINNSTGLKLTVKGNDELGIKMELPYLEKSPADVVITNNGNHNLLAYKIRWEGIKYNGEVVERQSIKYNQQALLEQDLDKRKDILNRQSLLPPHTKWFVGLGRINKLITGKVPTLDEVGRDPELFPDLKEYKQINVTLDAAILENGEVIGRDPVAFDKEIKSILSGDFNPVKENKNESLKK